jgi:hypothetical protein
MLYNWTIMPKSVSVNEGFLRKPEEIYPNGECVLGTWKLVSRNVDKGCGIESSQIGEISSHNNPYQDENYRQFILNMRWVFYWAIKNELIQPDKAEDFMWKVKRFISANNIDLSTRDTFFVPPKKIELFRLVDTEFRALFTS